MLKNIKGAIFDMDGTLVDSLMLWNIIWAKFGSLFCEDGVFAPSEKDDKAIRTMTLKDAMDYIHSRYNIGKTGIELFDKANEIINDFYSNEVMLKDGVAEFLEYCKAKGIKMCIASASDMEFLKIVAKRCDIEKYFVDIISCVDVGKGKEEPDIYLKAMEILGTTADETCIFEDSHVAICTADKLGIRTVGIYDKYNYGQEEIKKTATVYIAQGDTLKSLIV